MEDKKEIIENMANLSAYEKRELIREKWQATELDYKDVIEENGKICAMKRLGTRHIRYDIPCQDNFALKSGQDYRIIAIADGHGDKKHDLSEFGSRIACESLIEIAENYLNKKETSLEIIKQFGEILFRCLVVDAWKKNVELHFKNNFEEEFEEENTYVRYGTTLLFVIDYCEAFIVGQLGDGGILLSDGKVRYQKYRNDAKIGTGTASLCMEDSFMRLSVTAYSKKEFNRVMLMTDGLYDIFGEENALYATFDEFIEHFDGTEEGKLYFNEKYNTFVEYITDDTTVALMTADSIDIESKTEENDAVNEEYITIEEYLKDIVQRKKHRSDLALCFQIGKQLIEFAEKKENDSFMNEKMFRKMVRFNPDTGECIYVCDGENEEHWQNQCKIHIKQLVLEYMFDLFFSAVCGRLNLREEKEYQLIESVLKKNVIRRTSMKLAQQLIRVKKGEVIDFDELKRAFYLAMHRQVTCKACKKDFVLDEHTNQCPWCGQELIFAKELRCSDGESEEYLLPLVTGVNYTSVNLGFSGRNPLMNVIWDQNRNKFGLQNDSEESWTAYEGEERILEVPCGKVKGLDQTTKIEILNKTIFVISEEEMTNG